MPGRHYEIFGSLVAQRRAQDESTDLLSQLTHSRTETGELLPIDDVVDHMVFLLLAAHDTTTATLAVLLWEPARNPDWQSRVADELGGLNGAEVTLDNHKKLTDTSVAMNEALRLSPPVPFSPSRAEDRQHSHLFVPFGGGAHLCIGNHLAEVITKAVLARLLVRHRLVADPRHKVVIAPVPIPKPKSPLILTVH